MRDNFENKHEMNTFLEKILNGQVDTGEISRQMNS